MDNLLNRILNDIKIAMKSGEKEKLLSLRSLHSDIKNIGINQKVDLTDEVVITAVAKSIKQRRESLEQFKKGNRQDLVDKTTAEIACLTPYLPQQLSEDALKEMIRLAIQETGASVKKDMGKVMKFLMPKTSGKADGKLISRLVSELLA